MRPPPTPWRVGANKVNVVAADGVLIGTAWKADDEADAVREAEARAVLFAAAPDLLAACESAFDPCPGVKESPTQALLRAAIAKAMGAT